jgi:hypothetical protein
MNESLVTSTSLDKISVVIVVYLIPLDVAEMVADVHSMKFPLPRNSHQHFTDLLAFFVKLQYGKYLLHVYVFCKRITFIAFGVL